MVQDENIQAFFYSVVDSDCEGVLPHVRSYIYHLIHVVITDIIEHPLTIWVQPIYTAIEMNFGNNPVIFSRGETFCLIIVAVELFILIIQKHQFFKQVTRLIYILEFVSLLFGLCPGGHG